MERAGDHIRFMYASFNWNTILLQMEFNSSYDITLASRPRRDDVCYSVLFAMSSPDVADNPNAPL